MTYKGHCGNCTEYEFNGDNKKGYCTWYRTYYYPDDSCSHQKDRYRYQPSNCYITTIVCNILKNSDNCSVLEVLRSFRNNILQKEKKYEDLLIEYDIIGPIIAQNIQKQYQEDKEIHIWEYIYNNCLVPTTQLILSNNYNEAITKYTQMCRCLKEYYNIKDIDIENIRKMYDQSQGGTGNLKIKKHQ